MKQKNTAHLVALLKEQEAALDPENIDAQFEAAMDSLAFTRFRLCVLIFVVLIPLLAWIDFHTYHFSTGSLSANLRFGMTLVLVIFGLLTLIPLFKKNIYAFAFILVNLFGVYNLASLHFEPMIARDQYIVYALIFSILGVLMPWGGSAIAGLCLPVYLFYPLGLILVNIPVGDHLFLKSNLYLVSFILIVIVGASINERFRYEEFKLRTDMERMNRLLEEYQIRLKRSYERMENLAVVDPLTGVYNRTYMTQWLTTQIHKNPIETFKYHRYFHIVN